MIYLSKNQSEDLLLQRRTGSKGIFHVFLSETKTDFIL